MITTYVSAACVDGGRLPWSRHSWLLAQPAREQCYMYIETNGVDTVGNERHMPQGPIQNRSSSSIASCNCLPVIHKILVSQTRRRSVPVTKRPGPRLLSTAWSPTRTSIRVPLQTGSGGVARGGPCARTLATPGPGAMMSHRPNSNVGSGGSSSKGSGHTRRRSRRKKYPAGAVGGCLVAPTSAGSTRPPEPARDGGV